MKNIVLIITSLTLVSLFFFNRNDISNQQESTKQIKKVAKQVNDKLQLTDVSPSGLATSTKTQDIGFKLKKLTHEKLTDCLVNTQNCSEIKEFKRSVSSNGEYYNPSLTPYHHDFQARLERDRENIQTNLLFKALDIDNSGIYLLVIEELYRRDLSADQKQVLLKHINTHGGDVLASGLISAYRVGKVQRKLILDSFIAGIAKDYSSAMALAKRIFHLRPSFDELQSMVSQTCEYQNDVDEELFRTLISNYRRQANSLSLRGIYYCDRF